MNAISQMPILEIKRMFDAGPERVFQAWMQKDEWQAWIGPEGMNCKVPLFEPKVGGRYRLIMPLSSGGIMHVAGVFKAIDAPHSFAFTWGQEGTDQNTLVTVSLRAVGAATELTLRHEGLPTQELCDGHGKGWNSALNKLVRYLA
jgi:uncharacterized protein YndB with AHSA1/START domain